MFITFEGGEGAGKTTQIRLLKEYFEARGKKVVVTREPGGTALGEHVRNCLLNPEFNITFGARAELLLFLASRVEQIETVIKPALAAGTYVLCDRFNDSSIAYQGGARGLGIDFVESLCEVACERFTPDVTFYLDIDPALGMNRLHRQRDRMEGAGQEFHRKVREAYQTLAQKHPQRIYTIDAAQSLEQVHKQITDVL